MEINFATDRVSNPYISRNGNPTFVYYMKGTDQEIAAYKESNPKAITDEKGRTLFFSTTFYGKQAPLKKLESGKWIVDDSERLKFASLEKKYGTTVAREEMAKLKSHSEPAAEVEEEEEQEQPKPAANTGKKK